MQIGYIGLGKMGLNMVLNLLEKKHEVIVYNRSPEPLKEAESAGATVAEDYSALSNALTKERIFWIMVTHTAVDAVLKDLTPQLKEGDTVIDGGNSPYKDSMRRGKELAELGVEFLDVGVSGGPEGARTGASTMVGGNPEVYKKLELLFRDISIKNGYAYMGKSGAGHFVKMVHNGIEYGIMQSIAEGFDILDNSEFDLDFKDVMKPYRNGSVIGSRLLDWLNDAFSKYGNDLSEISDIARHSGEGQWTVEAAEELGIKAEVIKESLQARIYSEENPNFQARIVSAMRGEFGGHPVKKEDDSTKP